MDFDDTPREAALRAEARRWLGEHATLLGDSAGAGAARSGASRDRDEVAHIRRCKAWQRTLYDGGWAGITWPKEFGGRGASAIEAAIFNQECARFDVSTGIFAVGSGMVGPTLIAHGTPEQKRRYLDPLLRGEEVWCQLFSEPGAGSDLAGLATRAELDGDEWVVTGQKVWNSGAHSSDFGILLARTDSSAPKHRGITYFIVDMRTRGVDVRPLRQITGAAHFNEVFLTDVRIPAENVVGAVNGGWGPALTTLANERTLIGGGAGGVGFGDLAALAQGTGSASAPLHRQELAAAYTRWELVRFLGYRVQTALSQGRQPGPESSVLKLLFSQHLARTGDLALAMEGPCGMLAGGGGDVSVSFWHSYFLNQWASRIGGGTDQIQRNIIGERVLGLPGEPRVDKTVPFNELAASARPRE
ncbi:MAG: acyl-CoA dehydrogenase family protein [Acidimicrobiales bacterium]